MTRPLVVSNCALNVSGALSVVEAAAAGLGSSARVHDTAARRLSVQRNVLIFMAGNVPCRPAKVTRELFLHGPADETAAIAASGTENQPYGQGNAPDYDTQGQRKHAFSSVAAPSHTNRGVGGDHAVRRHIRNHRHVRRGGGTRFRM